MADTGLSHTALYVMLVSLSWFGIANISSMNAKEPDTVIADTVIQQWQVLI